MKPANFSTLLDDIRDAFADVLRMCSRAAKHIATLPWPMLLLCAFLSAIAITLIPVALTIFVLFLMIKLVVGLIVIDKQRNRGTDVAAKTFNQVMDFLREAYYEARELWWRFFDWVAVVEWRRLVLVWFIVFIAAGMLNIGEAGFWFMLISFSVKVLAGGKRRAELMAKEATVKADVANLERKLTEAQMAALQAQIEPHFLFNTLALIGQLIETDPAEAARVHQHLIDYLRSTLPQMRSGGTGTLGKQVELSRAYLAIMQARMKERLKVRFDVPMFLNSSPFPPMMLQTLIENSIKHGLEPKIEGGTIDVKAYVEGATLVVDVCDDGVGIDPHADDGVGLANIRERLQLLYGNRAELVVMTPAAGGACASVRIPYKMTEDA